jgi:hypothetical protein
VEAKDIRVMERTAVAMTEMGLVGGRGFIMIAPDW